MAHPGLGCQHGVCRLPATRLDRRARSLHATTVHEPGRQAGVQQRHHCAQRRRRRPHVDLRRRHAPADPALHDRRLSVVHAVADGDVSPLASAAAPSGWRWRAAINGFGALLTGRRADHRRGDQGTRRRLDRDRADSRHRDASFARPRNTTTRWRPADAARLDAARRAAPTSCWCRSAACSAPSSVRCDTRSRSRPTCARSTSTTTRRQTATLEKGVGDLGRQRSPGRPRVAVPFDDGAVAGLHRRRSSGNAPTRTSRSCCRSSYRRRWWHHLLHNQRALLIKGALLFRPNVVVTSVPFHLR